MDEDAIDFGEFVEALVQFDVAEAVAEKCAANGCDFGLFLGDNFYPTGVESATDPQFMEKFENPYQSLPFPFYVSLGNHDYGGSSNYQREKNQYYIEYGQQNSQWYFPQEFFALTRGPVHFLSLATMPIIMNDGNTADVQGNYFEAALDATETPWTIAFSHFPYLSNGPHGNATSALKNFFDDRLCGRVDLYLAGHDHNLQVLPGPDACPLVQVVAGGGGANPYGLPGVNPAEFQIGALGFAYFYITAVEVVLELIGVEGEVHFNKTIQK